MKYAAAAALAVTLAASGPALAADFTFSTPDKALPETLGNGLTGQLWINVPSTTDNLALAQSVIDGGTADANFLSTTVDYPAGSAGSTLTSVTYDDVLDTVGKATIDNDDVLTDDVLNTVMRFAGFFGVFEEDEEWTFRLTSDDGSALDIQGTRVINHDGIHGFSSKETTVLFESPGLYALDILFFESQPSHWGLEFAGGLNGGTVTTGISDRLYNLIDNADPDDDRLDSIAGVPAPGALALLGFGLLGLGLRRRI